ncbi:MAG: iron-containing alcohol dehydrogenase, partial [Eubacteriales bacterium]
MKSGYSVLHQSQLVTGRGSISFLSTMGKKRAAIFYDGRIMDDAARNKLSALLAEGGCESRFLADIRNEPFFSDILNAVDGVREFEPDLFVALGGGSVMDTAKAVWLFYEHPGLSFQDAFKPFQIPETTGKAVIAAIPTTSGTGSETTCCAVFVNQDTMQKQLILGFSIMPAYAILDPDFTDTLPDAIAAHTGMDALSHAIEAAVCTASSPVVVTLSLAAALDILDSLPDSVHAPAGSEERSKAREACHYSAAIAGVAINNSSAGLVHTLDQPGPFFNLPHGLVCGLLLPYTTAFHSPHPIYAKLGLRLGYQGSSKDACNGLVNFLWDFNTRVGIPHSFKELGIDESMFMGKIEVFLSGLDSSMAAILCPKKPRFEEAKQILVD